MMKKEYIPSIIISLLWVLSQVMDYIYERKYTLYFFCLFLILVIPVIIFTIIKQRKEDKLNNTTEFQSSIYRILFLVFLIVIFFVTKQNYI
ncbi:ABC-type multidrug transport system fused ATPase/permease subunit [Flavobacterium aquidurense]|nr:ABC-type multidrug transport system fused ATPase/permease subunit [Flavobacterium aquidurense]